MNPWYRCSFHKEPLLLGVFHKIFGGGTWFWGRFSISIRDGVRWEGGLVSGTESDEGGLGNIACWGQKYPPTTKLEQVWCFKHKIELSDAVLSQEVTCQNWEKNKVKFLKFSGETVRAKTQWGTGSGQKNWDRGWLGEWAKFSLLVGTLSPPKKKPRSLPGLTLLTYLPLHLCVPSWLVQVVFVLDDLLHCHT